jgi:tRNA modification GTPase
MSDTIFAPATAQGRAGIAVIRVSGPRAGEALRALTGRSLPAPRRATRARFGAAGQTLDDGLALWFPAPASFTGEDMAELHIHGGRATMAALTEALSGMAGLRLAEPGEFTRRAFDHGKLDLTAVEGLADLVAAETEAQRRQALRQLEGELGTLYEGWRAELLRILAWTEAEIDFSEEDITGTNLKPQIRYIRSQIILHLDDGRRGERLRDGVHIAIVGPPNVGKSSLLNVLAGREAAIVAPTAGTTRDVIEVHLDLGGYPVTLADTAGLREAKGEIEAEGVKRALARAESADLRLIVFDTTAPDSGAAVSYGGNSAIPVFNKIDLAPAPGPFAVSVKTGQGLDVLLAEITRRVAAFADVGSAPTITRARHREALVRCGNALGRALEVSEVELVAENLRIAVGEIGRITGRVGVEDILDVIFRDFCIGK